MVLFSSFQILEWYILIFVCFINFTFLLKVWLFASCLVFKLPSHQATKFSSLIIVNLPDSKNNIQNINSAKRHIFKRYNFIGRLRLIRFAVLKICKLDVFQYFKREYISFCMPVYHVGFYCNGMLCFAPIFFKLQCFFDGFGCSSESFHSENVLIDFRFFE